MAKSTTLPQSIDTRAHKAFNKVKSDIEALKQENFLLKEQMQHFDPNLVNELKRELTLLRDKQEQEVEKLKHQIAKCSCSENKSDINDLRRDISKINFSNVKDDVASLKETVREQGKQLKSLQTSVDKVLLSDSVSQRLDDLESDIEERFDTIERKLSIQGQNTPSQRVNEDEVIDKFASSYESQNEGKKGFKKWLFSKEKDTDDIREVE